MEPALPFRTARTAGPAERSAGLRAIAAFKLLGSALLGAVALGATFLLHESREADLGQWLQRIARGGADQRYVQQILVQVSLTTPHTLATIRLGAAIYAALLLTEGVGLWMQRRWAEYLTVAATASLIPVEIYELIHHLSATNLGVLLTNIVIVAYLARRVLQERGRLARPS